MFFTIFVQLCIAYGIQSAQTDTQDCNSCCYSNAGIPGSPGPSGPIGPPGERGITGEWGMKGEKRDKGDEGMPGILGPPGRNGQTGEPGVNGANGARGEKGEQLGELALTTPHKSAFFAIFKVDPGRHTVSPMKYETIIKNIGNHYSKDTGKFVCVFPGTYVFQVTSMKSIGSGKVITQIMKNGNQIMNIWVSGDTFNTGSTPVLVDFVAGDGVWTQPINTEFNHYYSRSSNHCSFSFWFSTLFLLNSHFKTA